MPIDQSTFEALLKEKGFPAPVLVERDAGGDLGNDFAGEFQDSGGPFIHAGLAKVTDAFDVDRIREILTGRGAGD